MANIRNQPPLPIEPAPIFTPVPQFNYAAHQLKTHLCQFSSCRAQDYGENGFYPNFSRAPQPLESYALEALNMKGACVIIEGRYWP